MQRLKFFDASSWIGENYLSRAYSVDDGNMAGLFSQRRKKYNIEANIVAHHLSLFYWPREGNDLLAQKIKEAGENIFGAMLFEQEYFSEPGLFKEGLRQRFGQGFRVVKLFPKSNKYPFGARLMAPFYKVLDYYRFPVMIGLDEIDITANKAIQWDSLAEIAERFKNMPLIIDGQGAKCLLYSSYFLSLMKPFANVYVTTHNLYGVGQIESLVDVLGKDRLLFDSYYPYQQISMGARRIMEAGISKDGKEAVAGGNIKRLISNIEVGQV
ncbi:MAG: amidohydrolase family protein [Actinomycetota bacterium]